MERARAAAVAHLDAYLDALSAAMGAVEAKGSG
jgi:hypothetical protein